ncbi:MAG: hypothetical protein HKP09_04895 [Enterobacterales bacterium]|nr:hypothetical protein [Enterobacterales bacterium]
MKLIPSVKITIFSLVTLAMAGCSTTAPIHAPNVQSPLGLYRTNTDAKYWLAILQNNVYLLCSPKECTQGKYERVAVDYGVILLDFYATDIGLAIEKLIHGQNRSHEFTKTMRQIRLSQERPDDQVFNINQCAGIPCVGIGHSREGIKFYRIESFDSFWNKSSD